MMIDRLVLADFRNYEVLDLQLSANLTVLVGPNGSGKTNVIEAIQLVTSARSFRRPVSGDVVRWGAESARVRVQASAQERAVEIQLDVERGGARTYRVNGQPRRRLSEVTSVIPSVVFTPDDLGMVKGSAEKRRSAADDLGETLSATYGSLRRDYGRVVKQRNALLREGAPATSLQPWDTQLCSLGAKLVTHRLRLLERVMARASERYESMADGESLGYTYADRCALGSCATLEETEIAARMSDELTRRASDERRRVLTLVGPHRDDVVFLVGGHDARSFASQGQQRTIALAWKLAEVEVVREVLRTDPVLLLDDVMSELDEDRRRALSELVLQDIQTVVTTTNTGYFSPEMLSAASVVATGGAGQR
jgi:DNA replication and repair protein RecF